MMTEEVIVGVFILGLLADAPRFFFLILTSNFLSKVSCGPFPTLTIALLISAPKFDDGSARTHGVSIDGCKFPVKVKGSDTATAARSAER